VAGWGHAQGGTAADRARLEAIVADRSSPQKHVWRAWIILATADGCGQPSLPMMKGRAGTMTHDYNRHGTTTLFAALKRARRQPHRPVQATAPAPGVHPLPQCRRAHGAGRKGDPRHPRQLIHVILDNYAAHKHAKVRHWLTRHPRWIFHFTPTSYSWLNAVEGVFATLAKRRLKRGVFPSLVALQAAINQFIEAHNRDPKPFVWKADPKAIIAAAKRGYQTLDSIH
jgi:transposase